MNKAHKRIVIGISLIVLVAAGIMIPLALIPQSMQVELVELAEIDTGGWAGAVVVENDIAYVLDLGEPTPRGLVLIDVSDPSNPVELGSLEDEDFPIKLDVEGDIVYVADQFGSLRIIDASDPTNPVQIGEYVNSGETYDVQVIGDIAYVADLSEGLIILNVSEPSSPEVLGQYSILGACIQLHVANDLVYVVDHRNDNTGLKVVNVSDPEHPFQIESYMPDDVDLCNPFVLGDYIYVGNHGTGRGELQILDATDPTDITQVGIFDNGGYMNSVFVVGTMAYVSFYERGLIVIDVSDPENPTFAASWGDGKEGAGDVVVVDDIVFLTEDGGGLTILQVTLNV